jgi:hypothetical protein
VHTQTGSCSPWWCMLPGAEQYFLKFLKNSGNPKFLNA